MVSVSFDNWLIFCFYSEGLPWDVTGADLDLVSFRSDAFQQAWFVVKIHFKIGTWV